MTYGSSTNGERVDGAADARRTDDTVSTDDKARSGVTSEASDRTRTAPVPERAAGAEPVHAPRTKAAGVETTPADGSRAHRPGSGGTTDHPERTDGSERVDRTGTKNAADAEHTARSSRTEATGVDRTGSLGAGTGTDRTGSPRTPGAKTDAAGTRHETAANGANGRGSGLDGALLAGADHDELERRMRDAVSDFVEDPQRAVREAGATLDAVTENLVKALTERSTALRTEENPDGPGARNGERTEQLRIVLQHYRDLTDRLLAV
ncbi:hypothetical protein OHT52_30290 [Streptomyces sp. NBC_00247]|uniref:hypothetical protein n=1 Tax=Streptomyces sp. NBC_00247 TaxID=2975689 RepID=UPI002E2C3770|nr:hypothetical protein [Streptomyces sp. NBC_00247]